jgi:hypothetical protein
VVTEATWYGFPISWFVTGETRDESDTELCSFAGIGPFSGVVEGALLLDVLIYMAVYYASVLAYVGIRSAVLTRMRLSSNAMKKSTARSRSS